MILSLRATTTWGTVLKCCSIRKGEKPSIDAVHRSPQCKRLIRLLCSSDVRLSFQVFLSVYVEIRGQLSRSQLSPSIFSGGMLSCFVAAFWKLQAHWLFNFLLIFLSLPPISQSECWDYMESKDWIQVVRLFSPSKPSSFVPHFNYEEFYSCATLRSHEKKKGLSNLTLILLRRSWFS